jgi:hypothetical protein
MTLRYNIRTEVLATFWIELAVQKLPCLNSRPPPLRERKSEPAPNIHWCFMWNGKFWLSVRLSTAVEFQITAGCMGMWSFTTLHARSSHFKQQNLTLKGHIRFFCHRHQTNLHSSVKVKVVS